MLLSNWQIEVTTELNLNTLWQASVSFPNCLSSRRFTLVTYPAVYNLNCEESAAVHGIDQIWNLHPYESVTSLILIWAKKIQVKSIQEKPERTFSPQRPVKA